MFVKFVFHLKQSGLTHRRTEVNRLLRCHFLQTVFCKTAALKIRVHKSEGTTHHKCQRVYEITENAHAIIRQCTGKVPTLHSDQNIRLIYDVLKHGKQP